jgi:hypothetical protein
MTERGYWLKSIGAAEPGLQQAEDWPDTAPQELHEVHFPKKGKPSVRVGDYLVYYASGQARIIGIAEVFTPPTEDSGEERWPWRCQVRPRIIINRISRTPSLDVMSEPERSLRKSVRQQSHISITEGQYQLALHALEDAFDASQGDQYYPWPSFETSLKEPA